MNPLQGEIALVSGGSRGIGAAVVRRLAKDGSDVAIVYRQAREQAEETAEACRSLGVKAFAYQTDVRFRTEVERLLKKVANDLGLPTILVHSAGVTGESWVFQDVTDGEYDRVMDTHVRGAVHLVQAVLPEMIRRRKGRIILLSSIWGESGGAGEVLYSAAKGALNGLARALAKEVAPSKVTVNAVAPGAIQTDMLAEQLSVEDRRELTQQIPADRLGTVEEVAALVCWLCLREAEYLTGQVLHINGGWYP
ncbi:beta-ketoacyl-ACP reductase [Kroppenstedtia guangzhouensis]|uniref:Beta-ketoacyl-ACP reductase n=1 Tax=Kroppenstedtia guangzhouensis TaxID=1274356 RepID=A0ABQ1G286_9BACL|nr:3-oxoacyl-ACP reductase FabG [Kroppenstedtia guangzhouensis]GGA34603.1 beta-ketoacyl-ACP reductase [Kroppenstedtia guangzhouensis]